MKKLAIILAAVLPGCISVGSVVDHNTTPAQNYRIQGEPAPVTITGTLDRKYAGYSKYNRDVNIFFNGELAIAGTLNEDYTGDLAGSWHNKSAAASCSASKATKRIHNVRCIVFVENERTVTLTF